MALVKSMHDYGISGHDRASIGRWLGVASIVIAGGLSQLLGVAQSYTGWAIFTGATIATGAVYFGLHFSFDKYFWKNKKIQKLGILKIPNLNGSWKVEGQTLNEDGSAKFEWEAKLSIEQDWSKIAIHLETTQSASNSYTATLHRRYGKSDSWQLSYSYHNAPGVEDEHILNSHRGFCELEFGSGFKDARGAYFNARGRRTFGTMKLTRLSND